MDQFTQNPASQTVVPRTSGLAVASFVMGLIGLIICVLWPILALPAIICGIIALVKISGSNGTLKGKGYAITGIALSAVMVIILPILAMLAAVLMPAFSAAKNEAQRSLCEMNERQIALALIAYANDSSGQLPQEKWMDVIKQKGFIENSISTCPSGIETTVSYVLNENIKNINEVKNPARTVLIFEAGLNIDGLGGPDDIIFPHTKKASDGCNVTFADGHTEFVMRENMGTLLWFPEQQ